MGEHQIGGIFPEGQTAVMRLGHGVHICRIAPPSVFLTAGAVFNTGKNRAFLIAVAGSDREGQCGILRQIGLHRVAFHNEVDGLRIELSLDRNAVQNNFSVLIIGGGGHHPVIAVQRQFHRWIYINANIGDRCLYGIIPAETDHQHQHGTGCRKRFSPYWPSNLARTALFALHLQKPHSGGFQFFGRFDVVKRILYSIRQSHHLPAFL
ncbi:hypothetical protein SDC9_190911 [bioreactor metagenome]|uniref:Uncharacterized protein n=1 Tax=bioreactor metagenome TaxID=1076179 RepID=A0A645HXX0_9ZZZZ